MKKEILSLEIGNSYITLKNKKEAQVVRLFFNLSLFKSQNNEETSNAFIYPCASILRLYVDCNYRRQGWATFVINKFFEICEDFNTFLVIANPDDLSYMSHEELKKFYKTFGFFEFREIDEGTLMIKYNGELPIHIKANGLG